MYRGSAYWSRSTHGIRSSFLKCGSAKSKLPNGEFPLKTQKSFNSTSSGSGGSGVYLGASIATVGAVIGGATTYAGYDQDFRKGVEDAVPFSKSIFDLIHGEMVKKKESQPPVEKDLSIPFQPLEDAKPDVEQTPLFADQLESSKEDEKSPAVNTLDTPAVSMIDLDISGIPKKTNKKYDEVEGSTSVELTTGINQSGMNEEDSPVVNTLDTPAVSMIGIDISSSKSEDEKLPDAESFVVAEKVDVAELNEEKEIVISEGQTEVTLLPEQETDSSDAITGDEKPLSAEEIETLSTLVDQTAMEILVNTSASNMMLLVRESTALQKQAAEGLREYLRSFASAIKVPRDDPEYEEKAKIVAAMESKAQEKFDIAKQKELSIKAEMESLNNLIQAVRESGDSEIADTAEISLRTCKQEMNTAQSEIDVVQKDFDFLIDYQKFIAQAPESLQGDLNLFAIDLVKLLEENKVDLTGLSQDQAILALALKRTKVLERAVQENPDSKYLEDMLEKQKTELEKLADDNLRFELKSLEKKLHFEYESQVQSVEEKYEKEMLSQLKRQASAHNEHIAEELEIQSSRLAAKYQTELDDKLQEQQKNYEMELQKNVACINGIKTKIADVVDIERRQKHAQEIWTATQALNSTLTVPTTNGRTRTLMPEMISVLQLGERNATLTEMVNCIPEEAALFGVIPEKDLLNRFKRVKQECKKVAMVSEGDSLGMYLLSYVKSLFVLNSWYANDIESRIDPEEATTYELLAKAEYFITQEGDLETAAKLMSQLKGVPRKLCGDWLNEVRLFLETKQTALLLQAYAASLTVGFE